MYRCYPERLASGTAITLRELDNLDIGMKAGDTRQMSQQMGSNAIGEFADLVNQMDQSEDDPRHCYALVQQRIREYRQSGENIPDDLVRMERRLMTECMAQSQGR